MNNNTHPKWEDFLECKDYEHRYVKFKAFTSDYEGWYLKKSHSCRFLAKQGLFLALNSSVLFALKDAGVFKPLGEFSSYIWFWLTFIPLVVLLSSFAPVMGKGFSKEHNLRLVAISSSLFFIPLVLHLFGFPFHKFLLALGSLGFGGAIVIYMINRLEGYTRGWSRYRTAGYKADIINAKFKAGLIFENDAHNELLKIIEHEVNERHQDIVDDFHFFGEKVYSFIPSNGNKKS